MPIVEDKQVNKNLENDYQVTKSYSFQKTDLENKLHILTPDERNIIIMRFGLNGENLHTLWEVWVKLWKTINEIRNIEEKAIEKLK